MTRAVCLLGSPRRDGNSDILAKMLCDALRQYGATTSIHALRDLQFRGYVPDTGSRAEQQLGPVKDDFGTVLNDVRRAQIVVLATPIYFCNVSGLMKQAFDRFYDLLEIAPDGAPRTRAPGTALVLVQTQGEDEARYGDLLDQYAPALDKLGFARRDLLRACGVREAGAVRAHAEVLRHAETLARSLMSGGDHGRDLTQIRRTSDFCVGNSREK